MMFSVAIYLLSFIVIWFGAGLIISSVDSLSKRISISPFLISFVVLGILTSIPEIAVGIASVVEQQPAVFVGNLLGGIPVIFLFVTPVLAIFGNGVRINHSFQDIRLLLALAVIVIPSLFVIDGSVSKFEATAMIVLYFSLVYMLKNTLVVKHKIKKKEINRTHYLILLIPIVIGTILVFLSSHIIVDKTLQIAKILNLSPFYLSLIGVSLGTNLPELSLAIRAVMQKKKDIAFGDYMGSAAANTVLFGIFSILINGHAYQVQNYFPQFIVLMIGLGLFYRFSRSQRNISRKEGMILIAFFLIFCVVGVK